MGANPMRHIISLSSSRDPAADLAHHSWGASNFWGKKATFVCMYVLITKFIRLRVVIPFGTSGPKTSSVSDAEHDE